MLLKGCTIEAKSSIEEKLNDYVFQLLLKGCTIEAGKRPSARTSRFEFQLLLKGCTIEALNPRIFDARFLVSVVVERMYD